MSSPCKPKRNRNIADQTQLEAFLLGSCEETTALAIEERLFADDDLYRELQAIKNSLIEREAAGTLPSEQSNLLRLQAMRSPSLMTEIEAARERLHNATLKSAASTSALVAFPRRTNRLIAAAAMILAVAGAAVLLYPAWHRSVQPVTATQAAIPTHAPAPANSANKLIATAHPAVFFLPAIHLRAVDQPAPTLTLPPPPTTLEIQVEIRGEAPESVTLRQGTTIIAAENHPTLLTAGPITYLSLNVDPIKLTPGNCQLEIQSENSPLDLRPFLVRPFSARPS